MNLRVFVHLEIGGIDTGPREFPVHIYIRNLSTEDHGDLCPALEIIFGNVARRECGVCAGSGDGLVK
jgi:hypothetical protein